ncbi:3-keto-disaccharide hydrolase [Chitinophaga lutea]
MKTIFLSAALICGATLCQAQKARPLFNGKDLKGWHMDVPALEKDSSLPIPFIVRNGLLVSLGKPQGHLITDAQYDNYTLDVEYRFAGKPGNCGVLVFASEPRVLYGMFPRSIEVQMMHKNAGDFWVIGEDITVPDMETRRGPKEKWGSVEGKERRIRNLTDSSEKPLGEWNKMRIVCDGNKVKVWVNGDLVNDGYDATVSKGQIALQAEGAEVEFRKVALTPLRRRSSQ